MVRRLIQRVRRSPDRKLEEAIGYTFRDRHLLTEALTHRSYRFETSGVSHDNQRLEFLGDAILGFLTARHVFNLYDGKDEGFLTNLRSRTTSGKALAGIAVDVELGNHLRIGKGEKDTGGRERPSNLTDALEAVIGAAYMDGGIRGAEKIYRKLFVPLVDALSHDLWEGNPKGRLQEYSQRRWKKGPRYRLMKREGPPHATTFTVRVALPDGSECLGTGPNKQGAESDAAAEMLKRL